MKTIVGRIVLIIAFPNIAKLLPSICARRESCSKSGLPRRLQTSRIEHSVTIV